MPLLDAHHDRIRRSSGKRVYSILKRMNLFDCRHHTPDTLGATASIPTPLGEICFDAEVDGVTLFTLPPEGGYLLPGGGHLLRWSSESFVAELLLCRPVVEPWIPPQSAVGSITDRWAGMWRLRALAPISLGAFSCEWGPEYRWREGGPNSGQWLDALTWDDGQVMVTMGTQDGEALANRARMGDGLPSRWASELDSLDWV